MNVTLNEAVCQFNGALDECITTNEEARELFNSGSKELTEGQQKAIDRIRDLATAYDMSVQEFAGAWDGLKELTFSR